MKLGRPRAASTEAPSDERLRAAATLPRARRPDGGPIGVIRAWLLTVGLGVLIIVPAFVGGVAEGLVAVAIAIPLFVGIELVARSVRGFAMGSFGVDPDGTVHVISGGRSVEEAGLALDDPGGWMTRVVVKGFVVAFLIIVISMTAALLLESELPFKACGVAGGLLLFVISRHMGLAARWRARTGGELLDARIMPYRLAVVARHRSLETVLGGIAADDLLAVLDEHQSDAERADAAAGASAALNAAAASPRWRP